MASMQIGWQSGASHFWLHTATESGGMQPAPVHVHGGTMLRTSTPLAMLAVISGFQQL